MAKEICHFAFSEAAVAPDPSGVLEYTIGEIQKSCSKMGCLHHFSVSDD